MKEAHTNLDLGRKSVIYYVQEVTITPNQQEKRAGKPTMPEKWIYA